MTRQFLRAALRRVARLYPLMSGCGSIAQTRPFASLLKGEMAPHRATLKSGEAIMIPPDDFIGRSVYYFGDLDPKISWVCQKILRAGDTALDIGANLGIIALRMAGIVGKSGTVHAFEPQPGLAALLVQSAALNNFAHLHVHPVALGTEDGALSLFIPHINAGSASLIRREGDGQAIEVPVKHSGPFLEHLGLGPIRLVKIDVEGFENAVFSGALDYLAKNPPDAILFEANDYSIPFASQPATKTLANLGYSFLAIDKAMVRMRLRPIDLKNPAPHSSNDILAIHNGPRGRDIMGCVGVV